MNGLYTVKSGYWLGMLGCVGPDIDPHGLLLRKQWVMVWNIPGPPKLRHFLWRLCKRSLATKHVLYNH